MKKALTIVIAGLIIIPATAFARLYSSDPFCNAAADHYAKTMTHGGQPGNPFYENYRDTYLFENCPGVEDDES